MKKINHYVLRGTIELLSGMNIGGSDDMLQIGGVDRTGIRDPATLRPYIPGSSLKGRMRSCLEKARGTDGREPCKCARDHCPVCRIFGPYQKADHQLGPTRIIVRDAPLVGEFTIENKTESTNKRDTGGAYNPRTVERVAPGARFALEIAMQEYDIDNDFKYRDADDKEVKGRDALWAVVMHALDLLEQTGIGAGTGKGYGKVKIETQPIEKATRSRRATFA